MYHLTNPLLVALLTSTLTSARAPLYFGDAESQRTFNTQKPALDDVKVPVQLGVMSRCPDAILCETVFDQVLKTVSNKVDLSLVYVAKFDEEDKQYGVTCLHGPEECAGNVHQLCAYTHAPSFSNFWDFVHCQNYQGRNQIGSLATARKCSKIARFDWEESQASTCAGDTDNGNPGEEGLKLLKESVQLGKDLGIEKSCTVLISGKQVCIHDGTWKECEDGHAAGDFIRQINKEYQKLNADKKDVEATEVDNA